MVQKSKASQVLQLPLEGFKFGNGKVALEKYFKYFGNVQHKLPTSYIIQIIANGQWDVFDLVVSEGYGPKDDKTFAKYLVGLLELGKIEAADRILDRFPNFEVSDSTLHDMASKSLRREVDVVAWLTKRFQDRMEPIWQKVDFYYHRVSIQNARGLHRIGIPKAKLDLSTVKAIQCQEEITPDAATVFEKVRYHINWNGSMSLHALKYFRSRYPNASADWSLHYASLWNLRAIKVCLSDYSNGSGRLNMNRVDKNRLKSIMVEALSFGCVHIANFIERYLEFDSSEILKQAADACLNRTHEQWYARISLAGVQWLIDRGAKIPAEFGKFWGDEALANFIVELNSKKNPHQ